MDDELRRRVEALEQEVAALKAKATQDARSDAWLQVPDPEPWSDTVSEPEAKPNAEPSEWSRPDANLEQRVAGKWLAISGITLLVLAVVFFFQLAVSRGWIGLAAQLGLIVLFGLGVWGVGVVMAAKQKLTGFAQVLSAGGFTIAAFAVFAAYHVESYRAATGISLWVDSLALAVIGIAAAVDAGVRKVQIQAGLAGVLIPWTALAAQGLDGFSLGYTAFMVAAMLAVGVWRGWVWLSALVAPAAGIVFLAHLVWETTPSYVFGAIVLVHLLVVAASVRPGRVESTTLLGHLISWSTFWLLGGLAVAAVFNVENARRFWDIQGDPFAWWSLAVALVGFTATLVIRSRYLRMVAGVVATIAAIVAPMFFGEAQARIPMWLAMFIAADGLRKTRNWTTSLSVRPILMFIILVHALNVEWANLLAREGPWMTDVVMLVASAGAAIASWHAERKSQAEALVLPLITLGLGLAAVLLLAGGLLTGPAVSVAWAVLGMALLIAGFAADEAQLRVAGLALFALVLLRIIVVDLDGVDAIWRVAAFVGIAAIFLFGSWLYVRSESKA